MADIKFEIKGGVGLRRLIDPIIRGGWPGSLGLSARQAALLPGGHLDAVMMLRLIICFTFFRLDDKILKLNKTVRHPSC